MSEFGGLWKHENNQHAPPMEKRRGGEKKKKEGQAVNDDAYWAVCKRKIMFTRCLSFSIALI